MKNLGPKSARWLNAVGLYTLNDLKALGSIETYYILKERGFPVSLNLVYAIEGAIRAITGTNYHRKCGMS